MRYSILAAILVFASACPAEDDSPAFTFTSNEFLLQAGTESIYCYYFHTQNTAPVAINKWVADMTQPGVHHMIFFTGGAEHADGLDMSNTCALDLQNLANNRTWVFSSLVAHNEQILPADDGAG